MPYRVAGFGPYRDVLAGLPYVADDRGFCPHPAITEWIRSEADRAFAQLEADSPPPETVSAQGRF